MYQNDMMDNFLSIGSLGHNSPISSGGHSTSKRKNIKPSGLLSAEYEDSDSDSVDEEMNDEGKNTVLSVKKSTNKSILRRRKSSFAEVSKLTLNPFDEFNCFSDYNLLGWWEKAKDIDRLSGRRKNSRMLKTKCIMKDDISKYVVVEGSAVIESAASTLLKNSDLERNGNMVMTERFSSEADLPPWKLRAQEEILDRSIAASMQIIIRYLLENAVKKLN